MIKPGVKASFFVMIILAVVVFFIIRTLMHGICSEQTQEGCDRSCEVDSDCKCTCTCGCLNVEEECQGDADLYCRMEFHPACVDGECVDER